LFKFVLLVFISVLTTLNHHIVSSYGINAWYRLHCALFHLFDHTSIRIVSKQVVDRQKIKCMLEILSAAGDGFASFSIGSFRHCTSLWNLFVTLYFTLTVPLSTQQYINGCW